MTYRQQRQYNFNPLVGILILFLFLFGIYFITKSLFALLWWVAPILFIVTLIMDYTVVLDYGKSLINLFKRNPLYGIFGAVFSVFGIHLVVAFLFGKAMLKSKFKKMGENPNRNDDGFTKFEEVEELELPTLTKEKQQSTRYDELFDE